MSNDIPQNYSMFESYIKHLIGYMSAKQVNTPLLDAIQSYSGKQVWVKMCGQNAHKIIGRWSEAQTAIIP